MKLTKMKRFGAKTLVKKNKATDGKWNKSRPVGGWMRSRVRTILEFFLGEDLSHRTVGSPSNYSSEVSSCELSARAQKQSFLRVHRPSSGRNSSIRDFQVLKW